MSKKKEKKKIWPKKWTTWVEIAVKNGKNGNFDLPQGGEGGAEGGQILATGIFW